MVRVPDLSGKTRADAKTAIANAGLKFGTESSSSNSLGSSYNGDVKSQTIAANTLVDYETEISFTYYNTYVPPVTVVDTVTYDECDSPAWIYDGWDYFDFCNGRSICQRDKYMTYHRTVTCQPKKYYIYSDGSTSTPVNNGSSYTDYQTRRDYKSSTTGGACPTGTEC